MKQLREQIKREIHRLMEEKYSLPQELVSALKHDLKLNPLVRYITHTKAAATVPPSYEVFLTNGQSFLLIYKEYSLAVKIEAKEYYLGDSEELALAKSHLNRLLQEPQIKAGEETTDNEDSAEADLEEPVEEPAEDEA